MSIVVSDTSPVRALVHVGDISLIAEYFELMTQLDAGEAQAIALAIELGSALLIDEAKGRAVAEKKGIPHAGALGLLALAKRDGRIPAVRPLLDGLRTGLGFRVSEKFFQAFLRSVGE